MNKKIITALTYSSFAYSTTLLACAPTGSVDNHIVNDCPVILSYDFEPGDITDVITSSVINQNISGGTASASSTNDFGYTANNVYVNNNGSNKIEVTFTVASGKTIELEGIQLLDYWSTEPTPDSAWDDVIVSLAINNLAIAPTDLNGNAVMLPLTGWRGTTDGLSASDEYWEFAESSKNTPSSYTLTANDGDLVSISLITAGGTVSGPRATNKLAIGGMVIHGCVVPEPSSSLLLISSLTVFILKRKR